MHLMMVVCHDIGILFNDTQYLLFRAKITSHEKVLDSIIIQQINKADGNARNSWNKYTITPHCLQGRNVAALLSNLMVF